MTVKAAGYIVICDKTKRTCGQGALTRAFALQLAHNEDWRQDAHQDNTHYHPDAWHMMHPEEIKLIVVPSEDQDPPQL